MFIPTFSKSPYPKLNIIQLVIPVIFLLLCMNTAISEKVSILLERFLTMIGLIKKEDEEKPQKKQYNDISQIPQDNFMPPPINTMVETSPMNYKQNKGQTFQQSMEMTPPPYSMAAGYGLQEPMASNEAGVTFLNY
jgi:hypothetical protein